MGAFLNGPNGTNVQRSVEKASIQEPGIARILRLAITGKLASKLSQAVWKRRKKSARLKNVPYMAVSASGKCRENAARPAETTAYRNEYVVVPIPRLSMMEISARDL